MFVQEIMDYLNQGASWVNFDKTRDVLLWGDPHQEVSKVGVCWVASVPAIEQAIEAGVELIISHENCFYQEGTNLDKEILQAKREKQALLSKHNISVYRCHDVWDKIPTVGVADMWSHIIGLHFQPRELNSFNSFATFEPMRVQVIAQQIAQALTPYGQDYVSVLGDLNKEVTSCGIGTGAATDVFSMVRENVQCVVLSDDGSNNWVAHQYGVDHDLPIILVHHSICEIPGIMKMVDYIKAGMPTLEVTYLHEGYTYHHVGGDRNIR